MAVLRQIVDFWRQLDPEMKKMFYQLLLGLFAKLPAAAQDGTGPNAFMASAEGAEFVELAKDSGGDVAEAEQMVSKAGSL